MDKVIVPTNLILWPQIKSSLPERKLIYMALWQNPQITAAGAYFLDLDVFAVSLGFARPQIDAAIRYFETHGLVTFDWKTSEILISDWWRFHSCKSEQQVSIVQKAVNKLQSSKVQKAILAKLKHVSNKINDIRTNPTLTKLNLNSTTTDKSENRVCSGGDLIFPKTINEDLRPAVAEILKNKIKGQQILDELGAALQRTDRPPIQNPIAWVRKLAEDGVDSTPAGLKKAAQRQATNRKEFEND